MPEAWAGSMATAKPRHFGLLVASAYWQARPRATTNSATEEKWTAQVGTERALAGSGRGVWRFPRPPRKASWASKCQSGTPVATKAATATAAASAVYRAGGESASSPLRAWRNPRTRRTFVTVSKDSAPPWSQSQSARETPHVVLEMIPVGMVASTKSNRYPNPNRTRGGAPVCGRFRKYRNPTYGGSDHWNSLPAKFPP
mmetsp:Transcript_13655/g.43124  ORF Transcript_13655/g.43124 Transcript_13655/m.43124 type:complete len:200 (-) Transcript_13655:229-828(-)